MRECTKKKNVGEKDNNGQLFFMRER